MKWLATAVFTFVSALFGTNHASPPISPTVTESSNTVQQQAFMPATSTVPSADEALFSDFGISFTYPKVYKTYRNEFGWQGIDGGYRVNFGINDLPGGQGRVHAFALRYPCDNCSMEIDARKEVATDVTIRNYSFKKITSLPVDNPYYPNIGYITYLYKDPLKHVVLYQFDFHYGTPDIPYADRDAAQVASDKIMASITIDPTYAHTDAYRVLLNKAPVISSLSGPQKIAAQQSGSWKVAATDPDNDALRYIVEWGDEGAGNAGDLGGALSRVQEGFATEFPTNSFTHTYKKPGTYNLRVSVMDNDVAHIADRMMTITVQ